LDFVAFRTVIEFTHAYVLAYFLDIFLATFAIVDNATKIAFISDRIEGHLFTASRTGPHSSTISVNEISYFPFYDDFSTVRAYEAYVDFL